MDRHFLRLLRENKCNVTLDAIGTLTYMSIRDEIASRCAEGRLFGIVPVLPGAPTPRTVFVSPEIYELVLGPWDDKKNEIRAGRLRADFDMFISGMVISIGPDPYKKKKTAYMSPLDPTADEVWQIRSRDPKPAIRVFGHFSEKDVFVALTWAFREELGGPGSRHWRDASALTQTNDSKRRPAVRIYGHGP